MDHHKRVQTSEAFINSAFLAVSGGFQDAYTYFTRDGVFSNAQTGNVVLMSERFMNGEVKAGLHYLIPLTAFFLGVLLAERIQEKFRYARRLHWRQGILLVEIILLFLVGFIPGNLNVLATTLVSFSCALQVDSFRKIRGNEVSIIFQDPMTSLNPVYTIGNQIVEVIRLHTDKNKADAWARAKELLELVGINEPEKRLKQYPHELSGGMRQRVMIAIALACEPKLLIADEPTTALDVTIQAQILELMQDLRKKLGMSIIMITHDLGVVASMCEKIAVMYAGHIVEYGTTDEIFYQPGHEYTKGLINSIPKLNTAEHERLVPIEGTPVDLLNPPAGCPFAPRCKNCMKICLSKMPPRTELSDTHYTYCWLQQKAAFEKGEKAE